MKKPLYIWLSIPAFVVQWIDTGICILISRSRDPFLTKRDKHRLWYNSLWNVSILFCGIIMVPITVLTMIFEYINNTLGGTWAAVANIFIIVYAYFAGVYATYRHALWRKNNLSR